MSFIELPSKLKQDLLDVAEQTILYALESGRYLALMHQAYGSELRRHRASFVTLYLHGQLRGCIGSLYPSRPLVEDVAHNAYSAAFRDPRFEPLMRHEFIDLHIEISVLSPLQVMAFENEKDLLEQLQPNVDGLILQAGERKAAFLPALWADFPRKQDFLTELKRRAGLADDFWSDKINCYRYTTDTFSAGRP